MTPEQSAVEVRHTQEMATLQYNHDCLKSAAMALVTVANTVASELAGLNPTLARELQTVAAAVTAQK